VWRLAFVSVNLDSSAFVHPTADVEDGVQIGPGTKVWHLAHIRKGAQIGADSSLGRNVYVDAGVSIGDRVKIQNNVSVYAGVTLEDDVFVGPAAVFTNDLHPRAHNANWKVTATTVREGASIGANATIVCGVELGAHSMVAAGAVVTRDVQPNQLVAGCPASHRGWVNRLGDVVSRDPVRPADDLLHGEPNPQGSAQ
jgi:UDP-2-acetamido-3-amino-2,3-dideoxy-glucuronate N-acetyltransferase